jgi:signal peptidase I
MSDTAHPHRSNIRETLISIIIAFAMAFVFRGFVVEAFLIPTGSMAPTLRGAHMQFQSPQTGYQWAVNPWYFASESAQDPLGTQMGVRVHDPVSGAELSPPAVKTRWGDRIFVMKYLYSVYDPERYDVVVFKNPTDPSMNFIKRLIGLPGEMIALVDGDVFVRRHAPGDEKARNTWLLPGWTVARKPERAQRAMWQEVYSSEYQPLGGGIGGRPFRSPWRSTDERSGRWQIAGRRSYAYDGSAPTTLEWNAADWPITDLYPYNETRDKSALVYPVSDIRVRLGLEAGGPGAGVSAVLTVRGHEFRADVEGQAVSLRMKPVHGGDWSILGEGELSAPLGTSPVTNLDFWFVDQSLIVFEGETEVARGLYSWSPDERLMFTIGQGADRVLEEGPAALLGIPVLDLPRGRHRYPTPQVRLEFTGGPLVVHRLGLWRDIYFQPDQYQRRGSGVPGGPAGATHPLAPKNLSPDQFFVCGDNSPASLDARLWPEPNPWVALIDPDTGVVHRDLLIGKAFFVYFPSPHKGRRLPVPDFGRMRFIW